MNSNRKRLLLYYPPNKRAIGLNAVIDLLSELPVEIFVLTQEPEGQVHDDIRSKLEAGHYSGTNIRDRNGFKFYYKHTLKLLSYCRDHKIDVVFSHLQQGNMVSGIASLFLPQVKFYFFRHHFQYYKKFKLEYLKSGRNELLGEKLVNWLARVIVVPSSTVKEGMIRFEQVNPQKIKLIPYIYNFQEYPAVNKDHVDHIRQMYNAELLLVMSSRFVKEKRHQMVIEIIAKIIKERSLDIKLLLLDDGPLRSQMQMNVNALGLNNNVFFVGFTTAVLDYMAASDLLIHPSLSEASNSSVKEMAMVGKTAVVCHGIGDFDDYFRNKINGFLIDPFDSAHELEEAILFAYHNRVQIEAMGSTLRKDVLEKFSPSNEVLRLYKDLIDG